MLLRESHMPSNIVADLPFLLHVATYGQRSRYLTPYHIRPCLNCCETLPQSSLSVPSSPQQTSLNMMTLTQCTLVLIKLKCFLSPECILPPSNPLFSVLSLPRFSTPSFQQSFITFNDLVVRSHGKCNQFTFIYSQL